MSCCTADVGRDQRKCQLRFLRFVRQVGGGSILFAYRLQGEGVVPECFLVFLFDLQTLLLPILTIVLVQAYAIADEVLVGTGGSYDDTVDIGLIIPSVVADAYTGGQLLIVVIHDNKSPSLSRSSLAMETHSLKMAGMRS